jgi:hypothetical protein
MQFALYYVLWPFIGGAGFIYIGLMIPEAMWWFLILWFLPWVTWPVGTYRRRYMNAQMEAFKAEAEKAGEVSAMPAIGLVVGPPMVMVLAAMIGTFLAPIYIEDVMGVDLQARVEQMQQEAEARKDAQGH